MNFKIKAAAALTAGVAVVAVPALITSAIIVLIRNAVDSLTARRGGVTLSDRSCPLVVSTRRINAGVGTIP